MRKITWITLLVGGTVAGFVVGVTVARRKKPEVPARQDEVRAERKKPESDRALLTRLEQFRKALAGKEKRVSQLEAELAEVKAKLPPPVGPEERKLQKEYREWKESLMRDERGKARYEKSKELSAKILQRKDKGLRAQGLEELAALLQSEDREELLVGLGAAGSLGAISCDRERFNLLILKAMSHADAEIREAALDCTFGIWHPDEHLDALLGMARDPSLEIRRSVAESIRWLDGDGRREEVASVLRELLKDDDTVVRIRAAQALWEVPEYAQEMEDFVIELSRSAENREEARKILECLWGRAGGSAKIAQRVIEMYDEGHSGDYMLNWTMSGELSEPVKLLARQFCLRVLRESVQGFQRQQAALGLMAMGDPSVLPELEEIARSEDAEGIEGVLTGAIRHLREQAAKAR